jgi:CRISPR-associated protein Csx10
MARSDVPLECPVCAKADDATGRQAANVKLEAVNGFVSLVKEGRSKHKSKQTSEMHIRIESETGRVRTGNLFGYVSLEPGQYFVGEITCTSEAVWQVLQEMADLKAVGQPNELRFGKASRRGHGKASVVFQTATQPPWQGSILADRIRTPSEVILLLVSDAIVVDPWERYQRGFDTDWIKRELGLPETCMVSIDKNAADEDISFSAVRAVDAFNAKLGLPRSRDMAIVAGSCARLSFTGIELADLVKALEKVEGQGIGLRRDEGFGRVAFNHPVHDKNLANWGASALDLSQLVLEDKTQRSHPSTALIQFLLDWMKKLDEEFKSGASKFNDERFEAVARLLHVSRKTSASQLKREIQRVGEMAELLPETLKGRDKNNFFKTDGKSGTEMIASLLDEMTALLQQRTLGQDAQAWRVGLQMLAARIAEPARQKAQERR